jgi:hypothetical protein
MLSGERCNSGLLPALEVPSRHVQEQKEHKYRKASSLGHQSPCLTNGAKWLYQNQRGGEERNDKIQLPMESKFLKAHLKELPVHWKLWATFRGTKNSDNKEGQVSPKPTISELKKMKNWKRKPLNMPSPFSHFIYQFIFVTTSLPSKIVCHYT